MIEGYNAKEPVEEPGAEVAVQEAEVTILDPSTGELVPASDVPGVAAALANLREYAGRVREAIRAAEDVMIAESERQGTKTMRFGRTAVEVYGGSELQWDVEVLGELEEAGLPEERMNELVKTTFEHKVDSRIAKQLEASNPVYAEIIERARTRIPKPRRAKVTHS